MAHHKVDATKYKKTKIIATIGPASQEKIEDLLSYGVNGIRLNFSHNTHQWHLDTAKKVRKIAKKLDRSVAIIQDLPGPKIRIGKLKSGGMEISAGQVLKFQYSEGHLGLGIIPIQHDFSGEVKKGQRLFLRDGQIQTEVVDIKGGLISAKAINSGKIMSDHGINLPDTVFTNGVLSKKDKKDLTITAKLDADYVAVSFAHTPNDILHVKKQLREHKADCMVIAKIETKSAVENLEEIIKVSDAVMIARGDLAIEIGPEQVPIVGREIILLCRRYKKPVIMATQMLESMITSTTPTRAEANDVATAVSLGVDSLMLSGETAIGQFPVETVRMMKRIILSSEQYFVTTSMSVELMEDSGEMEIQANPNEKGLIDRISQKTRLVFSREPSSPGKISTSFAQTSVSFAAITLSEQIKAKFIVAETLTGSTAFSIASLRPSSPIAIVSPTPRVCNQCSILWGGKTFLVPKSKSYSQQILKKLKDRGGISRGDWVVEAFGQNKGVAGGTDTVRLVEVK
jgi:pyruvate kinase